MFGKFSVAIIFSIFTFFEAIYLAYQVKNGKMKANLARMIVFAECLLILVLFLIYA